MIDPINKICEWPILEAYLNHARIDGKKIGFTNGCFDLLHIGHLDYLRKAKTEVDILVLGLNSDSSVRQLKGETRPVNSEKDRALFLAHLCYVDFIIIFEEETPEKLIRKIKPNILIKGSDYMGCEIAGADYVEKNGGKVVLKKYILGYSTTNIIKKIKES